MTKFETHEILGIKYLFVPFSRFREYKGKDGFVTFALDKDGFVIYDNISFLTGKTALALEFLAQFPEYSRECAIESGAIVP